MKSIFCLAILVHILALWLSPSSHSQDAAKLLLRVDDIGMCHDVNMALQQVAETGMPFSTSVMFTCPWYLEAVDILKRHPEIAVGIHLTLNSEWKYYK